MGWGCEWQEMRPSGNWGCSYVRPVDQGKEGGSGAELRQEEVVAIHYTVVEQVLEQEQ